MSVRLTSRENRPDEVYEEVVHPEVQELRSAVRHSAVVMVEHARGVV